MLSVLPTGAGKTISFASLISGIRERTPNFSVLIIVHRINLALQLENTLVNFLGQANVGVYCGSLDRYEIGRQFVIGTLQSVSRIGPRHFDMVILDEVHRFATTKSSLEYIEKVKEINPKLRVLGVTATPYANGELIYGTHKLFKKIAFEKSILDLTKEGYLVPAVLRGAKSRDKFDVQSLKVLRGDYGDEDLKALVQDAAKTRAQVASALDHAHDRRKIVWCCINIEHAERVNTILAELGESSSLIHSEIKEGYESVLSDFRTTSRHLVFVTVVAEGFDYAPIDCVVLLRPTRSPTLFIQVVGRGLRLHPGKSDCLVLDYGDVVKNCGPLDRPLISGAVDGITPGQSNAAREEKSPFFVLQCQACGLLSVLDKIADPKSFKCTECGTALEKPQLKNTEKKLKRKADEFAPIYSTDPGWTGARWYDVRSITKVDVDASGRDCHQWAYFEFLTTCGMRVFKQFQIDPPPDRGTSAYRYWMGRLSHYKRWLKDMVPKEFHGRGIKLMLLAINIDPKRMIPKQVFADPLSGKIMGWNDQQPWRESTEIERRTVAEGTQLEII